MKVLAIVGPTASGKTAFALRLAERFPVRIVSVDSRKVYKKMDIGTAKPPPEKRGLFRLIDILEPSQRYSAAQFARDAEREVKKALEEGLVPVMVGGTVLYYKAFFEGLFEAPEPDPALRQALLEQVEKEGSAALWRELARVDPEAAGKIHPNDWVRITRALEVYYQTGVPISQLRKKKPHRPFEPLYVSIPVDRKTLYEKINARVDRMMKERLLEETRRLLEEFGSQAPGLLTIGYRELVLYLMGKIKSLEIAVNLIKKRTRQFARRQIYFMRSLGEIKGPEVAWEFLEATSSSQPSP